MPSRQIDRTPPGPEDPRHGEYRGYIAGCRLDCCVQAERRYARARKRSQVYGRPLKVDSGPSRRQLEALMAIGWPGTYLAERLGLARPNLPGRHPTMRVDQARKVQALYDELSVIEGPSEKSKSWGRKLGFAPPEHTRSRQDAIDLIRRGLDLGVQPESSRRYLNVSSSVFAELYRLARETT